MGEEIVGIAWQYRLDMTKVKSWTFAGSNGAGACTLAGVTVGSVVLSVTGVDSADGGDQSANFESVITVAGEIQQSSVSDLSTKDYTALIYLKG